MADLLRSLGSEAAAAKIESTGCPWWWAIQEQQGNSGAVRVREACGVGLLPELLTDQGALIREALQTAQSSRNEIAKGFERLAVAVETTPVPAAALIDLLLCSGQPVALPAPGKDQGVA